MDDDMSSESASDNAGVRVPPPLIFLGFLLVGLPPRPRKNIAVPENRRFVTNCRRRHYPVCLRLMKSTPTRPRSDEPQEVWNRIGPSAFAR